MRRAIILSSLMSRTLRVSLCHTRRRILQNFDAALKPLPLSLGHLRLENLAYASPADHAWKRDRDAVFLVVRADGNHGVLIAQDRFGDARRDHANAQLACARPFDDRDVREAHILLDALAEFLNALTTFFQQLRDWRASNACPRP